ncbi:transcriptional regulator opi1 [Basidiobolus ranarum]|uniref:Transcriptional regulator opi1 n=1 Tax=Basidiobolus ranarum TaxID=34480 RepID=A0ABR2W4E1_9FUNG
MMGIPETGQSCDSNGYSKSKRNGFNGSKPEVLPESTDLLNNQYNYLLDSSTFNHGHRKDSQNDLSAETSLNTSNNGHHIETTQRSNGGRDLDSPSSPRNARNSSSTLQVKIRPSPMSITELCNNEEIDSKEVDEKDLAVQIAAQALDDMRTMGATYSDSSNTHSVASPTTSEGEYASMSEVTSNNEHFISRVSNIPLVNTALRFYEQTKANSRVVKYGVETVESSVKSICQPMINKIEPHLGHLEEFACRQLDTLEKRYPTWMGQGYPNAKIGDELESFHSDGVSSSRQESKFNSDTRRRVRRREEVDEEENKDPSHKQRNSSSNDSNATNNSALQPVATAVQPRSRWEQYLVEASTAAGAGAAVFSEESMKALKYCLQWLQFASHNIDAQIGLLREFLLQLSQPASNSTAIAVASPSTLSSIKREVIETLRKVVDVVGRYAGACLPGEARNRVRDFILNLPGRWATINMHSSTPSPASSPLLTPTSPSVHPSQSMSESARRILTLATESLLMLQSVAGIFKDSVERAESWVDRLRSMGMSPTVTNGEDQRFLPSSDQSHPDQMAVDENEQDRMDVE